MVMIPMNQIVLQAVFIGINVICLVLQEEAKIKQEMTLHCVQQKSMERNFRAKKFTIYRERERERER